ncbi:MAG TPA: hypothetical protein VGD71_39410 [Kribbella sp.]
MPTGPFPVGTTELHLIDRDRDDSYVPGRSRELMISLWYPSRGALATPAPYGVEFPGGRLRSYLPAFLYQHLRGRRSTLWDGASPRHPDVRFIA